MPVHFRKKQLLISPTGRRAGQAVDKVQPRIDLVGGQSSRQKCGVVHSGQIIRLRENGNAGKVPFLLIVAEKEKRLVLNNRSTDGCAKLIACVGSLISNWSRHATDKLIYKTARIACAPLVVAIE